MKKLTLLLLLLSSFAFAQQPAPPKNRGGLEWGQVVQIVTPEIPAVLDSLGNVITPKVPAVTALQETGTVDGIKIFVKPDSAVNFPHTRALVVTSNVEERDQELLFNLQYEFFATDSVTPIRTAIQADTTLSPTAKNRLSKLFEPFDFGGPKSTRGSRVNAQTGELLPAGSTEGVTEKWFFQHLTIAHLRAFGIMVTASTPIQVMRYYMEVAQAIVIARREGVL